MTDAGQSPTAGPSVCPFVALAEDRDRRADAPAEGNRCYAEKAPRRRDLIHQAEFCYSQRFPSCSIFLAWAARSAAEPAYVSQAAQRAWGSGVAQPESGPGGGDAGPAAGSPAIGDAGSPHAYAWGAVEGDVGPSGSAGPGFEGGLLPPTPEGGLFGPADPADTASARTPELLDWVSASAWADAPWDPEAEAEAEERELLVYDEPDTEPALEAVDDSEEALQAPKVPAALPMRRRRSPQEPIRTTGSGEWYYADPPGREPISGRRGSAVPPILLAVLGLLVVALVVVLVPTLLGGGGEDPGRPAAAASPSAGVPVRPVTTPVPQRTPDSSPTPSPTPQPEIRSYTIKPGDTLSGIAANPRVRVDMRLLQCFNGLVNPNLLQPGQKLRIPPDGYTCPAGWRRATPQPSASPAP